MKFLAKIICDVCNFAASPESFPDIETKSVTKNDFDRLSDASKTILKKFKHDITDFECRLRLHGRIFICPVCGNTEHFDLKTQAA